MPEKQYPHRLRRLSQTFDTAPSYFLTLCTANRIRTLDNPLCFERVKTFVRNCPAHYGMWVDSYVIMPDHIHLIVTVGRNASVTIGQWVKALKAVTANKQFRWQKGFFDHVLRNEESRSEKWDYIRMNPVRAGLVQHPDDWPYAERFNSYDGSELVGPVSPPGAFTIQPAAWGHAAYNMDSHTCMGTFSPLRTSSL